MEHQSVDKANNKSHQNETQPVAKPEPNIQTPVYPIQHLHQTISNQSIGHLVQRKSKVDQTRDAYEQEADQISNQVMSSDFGTTETTKATQMTHTNTMVQRFAKAETTDSTVDANSSPVPAEPVAEETNTPVETPSQAMIVDDSTEQLMPGQMRKSEFLDQLYDDVCNTANEILSGTGRSTEGCPYLDYWFRYYRNQDGQHIERAINKYAPESSGVTSAQEYIPLVASRVGSAVATWATTGEITGVPEGISGMGTFSGIGSIFFKSREGGARGVTNPQAIQSQLSSTGSSLDSGVRSRIESTFGVGLSHVRVHTDSNAARLSDGLNARAFTIGKDIAFGSGEYQPGTPMGDALIAHELAHVVQQGDGKSSESKLNNEITNQPLEEDADKSAIGAIASIWGGTKGAMKSIAQNAIPRMRSGLQLSRCKSESESTPTKAPPVGSGSSASTKKTLTLNVSRLDGSSRTFDTLDQASKVLDAAANITIPSPGGNIETVNPTDSKALIGNDLILDEYTTIPNATTEEVALTARNRTPGVITAYFVKSMSHGSHGEAFPGSLFPKMPPSVAIKDGDSPFVTGKPLAHELGHMLLDIPDDPAAPATNLMSYSHTGVGLTPAEVTTARKSPFVK